jgi:recombination protein RecT
MAKAEETSPLPAVQEKNIADKVLAKIVQFQATKEISLPKDYSAENALKSAFLILQETVDRDKKPVLTVCTRESIANSLLDMVVQGLSPVKKQCYFIAYGTKLQLSRSYQGSVAIAKRVGMKSVVANVIYEDDIFKYEIISETGRKRVVEHTQELTNIDLKKIKGAYAITEMEDGTKDLEVMNMVQIRNAWNQGAAKGNSGAHTNFTDEMCCKTVIQRATKDIINSSDDSHLHRDEDETDPLKAEVQENANRETISFTDAVEVVEEPKEATKPTDEKPEDGKLFPKDKPKGGPGF